MRFKYKLCFSNTLISLDIIKPELNTPLNISSISFSKSVVGIKLSLLLLFIIYFIHFSKSLELLSSKACHNNLFLSIISLSIHIPKSYKIIL